MVMIIKKYCRFLFGIGLAFAVFGTNAYSQTFSPYYAGQAVYPTPMPFQGQVITQPAERRLFASPEPCYDYNYYFYNQGERTVIDYVPSRSTTESSPQSGDNRNENRVADSSALPPRNSVTNIQNDEKSVFGNRNNNGNNNSNRNASRNNATGATASAMPNMIGDSTTLPMMNLTFTTLSESPEKFAVTGPFAISGPISDGYLNTSEIGHGQIGDPLHVIELLDPSRSQIILLGAIFNDDGYMWIDGNIGVDVDQYYTKTDSGWTWSGRADETGRINLTGQYDFDSGKIDLSGEIVNAGKINLSGQLDYDANNPYLGKIDLSGEIENSGQIKISGDYYVNTDSSSDAYGTLNLTGEISEIEITNPQSPGDEDGAAEGILPVAAATPQEIIEMIPLPVSSSMYITVLNVSENYNAEVTDRCYVDLRIFSGAQSYGLGGISSSNTMQKKDMSRLTLGFEKKIGSRNSVELRLPIVLIGTKSSQNVVGIASPEQATEFGNFSLIYKNVIYKSHEITFGWGIGLNAPTAPDMKLTYTRGFGLDDIRLRLENRKTSFVPYVGLQWDHKQTQTFGRILGQFDFAVGKNRLQLTDDRYGLNRYEADLTESSLFRFNFSLGRWLYSNQTDPSLFRIGGMFEVHATSNMNTARTDGFTIHSNRQKNSSFSMASARRNWMVIDLVGGVPIQTKRMALQLFGVVPVTDVRTFSFEGGISADLRF